MTDARIAYLCALGAIVALRWTWGYCEGFYAPKARKSTYTPINQAACFVVDASKRYGFKWKNELLDSDAMLRAYQAICDAMMLDPRAFPEGWGKNRETVAVHIEAASDAEAVTAYLKQYGV